MKRKDKLPELLAPAGSFECLLAAVEAGADAVYVGGKRFGARAYAKNFSTEELGRAVSYCHLHGVKLYVTLNTLILDLELKDAVEYAKELWQIGVDALIVADLGVAAEIKKYIPSLEIHASTQASIHNTNGAEVAKEMGCTRAVVARELSLENITEICEKSSVEIEVFLHGALCVCHSGQCLFSSLVGGRSGNRGECAQPCRLPYNNGKYALSLKDLSLASHIRELISSGVASLKIEGRMKSAAYVYTVTGIYRKLLDEERDATEEELLALKKAFSRGGFTDGYLRAKPQSVELGMRSDKDKEESKSLDEKSFSPIRKKVFAKARIVREEPISLTLFSNDGRRAEAVGPLPNEAENSPLVANEVKARLSKMGNTFLSLSEEDIELTLDEGLNLSPSALNALRREAAERFETLKNTELMLDYSLPQKDGNEKRFHTAVFLGETLPKSAPRGLEEFDAVFVSLFLEKIPEWANGVYLPPIITDSELQTVKAKLSSIDLNKTKYALVENIGQFALAQEYGLKIVCDFRLNVTNRVTKRVLKELGAEHIILSPEITLPQARDIGGGVTVYGRIPLMITERCFMKENGGCSKCSNISLVDRRGERFPIIREFKHRNLILNSAVTYMGDKRSELSKNKISSYHFIFSTETAEEISAAISSFKKGDPLVFGNVRRVGRRKA